MHVVHQPDHADTEGVELADPLRPVAHDVGALDAEYDRGTPAGVRGLDGLGVGRQDGTAGRRLAADRLELVEHAPPRRLRAVEGGDDRVAHGLGDDGVDAAVGELAEGDVLGHRATGRGSVGGGERAGEQRRAMGVDVDHERVAVQLDRGGVHSDRSVRDPSS